MSFILRQVAHCDVCGHEWLTAKVPSHCAKCKSRKWNQAPIVIASLQGPTAFHKRRTYTHKPLAHNPKTCRIYKCGMCAAVKG